LVHIFCIRIVCIIGLR